METRSSLTLAQVPAGSCTSSILRCRAGQGGAAPGLVVQRQVIGGSLHAAVGARAWLIYKVVVDTNVPNCRRPALVHAAGGGAPHTVAWTPLATPGDCIIPIKHAHGQLFGKYELELVEGMTAHPGAGCALTWCQWVAPW